MCGGRKNLVQKIWLRIWMEPDGFQRRAGRGWRRTVYGEGLYLLQIPRKTRSRSTSNAADTKLERRFRLHSLSAGVFGGFCGGSEAGKAPPRTPVCILLVVGVIIGGSFFLV